MFINRALLLALMSAATGSAAPQSQAPSQGTGAGAGKACGGGGSGTQVNANADAIPCSQPAGDFNITAFRLYPENADHDPRTCRTYFSVLYNASVAVYDSNEKRIVDTITIEGLTGNPALHASGVQVNPKDNTLAIMINSGAAFDTEGNNTAGDNHLVVWDLGENKKKFSVNLSDAADEGHRGFQDMEHDEDGNIFALSSFGGSLLRVGAQDRQVEKWWLSEKTGSSHGITGLARFGQDTLIVADQGEQGLFRHSMKADGKDKREAIKLSSSNSTCSTSAKLTATLDGVYFPPKHQQTCLLVSDNAQGTIVLTSADKWQSGKIRGIIPNKFASATPMGFSVATVQMADRIFTVMEWFADVAPKNRSDFPMIDITDDVARLCGDGKA